MNTQILQSNVGKTPNSCDGCRWYLGGAICRIGVKAECSEGGGYELYEQREVDE